MLRQSLEQAAAEDDIDELDGGELASLGVRVVQVVGVERAASTKAAETVERFFWTQIRWEQSPLALGLRAAPVVSVTSDTLRLLQPQRG